MEQIFYKQLGNWRLLFNRISQIKNQSVLKECFTYEQQLPKVLAYGFIPLKPSSSYSTIAINALCQNKGFDSISVKFSPKLNRFNYPLIISQLTTNDIQRLYSRNILGQYNLTIEDTDYYTGYTDSIS